MSLGPGLGNRHQSCVGATQSSATESGKKGNSVRISTRNTRCRESQERTNHTFFPENTTEQSIWEGKYSRGGSVQLWQKKGGGCAGSTQESPPCSPTEGSPYGNSGSDTPAWHNSLRSLPSLGLSWNVQEGNCCLNFPPKPRIYP